MMKDLLWVWVAVTLGVPVYAEQPVLDGEVDAQGQSLEQAVEDPTASLMNVQIGDWYTSDFHNLSGEDDNTVVLRSALPFKWGKQSHIFRITMPFITDSPFLDTGLSDTTIFDLMTFDKGWGRWGVGAVALLPTGGADRGAEKWGLGPAVGFTAQGDGFLWGLFNQNIFTVAGEDDRADINVSVLQPIFNVVLGNGWTTGVSEMSVTYDWENSKWASLPLGVKIAKLVRFGKLPVQFNFQYEYNFADDSPAAAENTFRFTLKFVFPSIL
jgi:hypothetical protein